MKNYYVLSNGRVKREQNTVFIETADGQKKPIPVEDVDSLYLYGEVDLNTRLLNFLSQKKIPLHVFNYYGFYSGSYYPREYLHSGYLLVHQVAHYGNPQARCVLAREMVRGAAHSILRNVSYYERRRGDGPPAPNLGGADEEPAGEIGLTADDGLPTTSCTTKTPRHQDGMTTQHGPPANSAVPTDADAEAAVDAGLEAPSLEEVVEQLPRAEDEETAPQSPAAWKATGWGVPDESAASAEDELDPLLPAISFPDTPTPLAELTATLQGLALLVETQTEVNALRGVEGKMRERYYQAWRHILREGWAFERRVRRPPDNEVNALISFGNSVLDTVCLSEIYRTQLTPTISYLHEPGERRFSLALDLSEIFKPLIVDRAIFRLINTGQLRPAHFDSGMDGCFLTDAGKRLFLAALEERLGSTIRHRRLGRHVSYRHLVRLECYKLIRHLTGVETYRAFRAWW